ncbi:MAG: preprotein translocase subunit SecY [Defluviitaleaceae bacterium]|nr:preprotein translocase subunit SecY [Defluviitaleaceae bacterium]MCL2273619.1 preprotein translocase subunit SecY [Defluviitaleaceae bacterium]
MFKIFINAWRVTDIRRKLLFIFLLLFIYRIGSVVPLPGIDLDSLYLWRFPAEGQAATQGATFISLIMGGGHFSVFAMGIAPYITASIIMQLLTYAIPAISQMQKDGEDGRKKIGQITRYLAVGFAVLQAAGTVFSYTNWPPGVGDGWNMFRLEHQNMLVYVTATVAMTTGTIFIMWLAELLTEKGIGSGASFLIFANILAGLPNGILGLWGMATDPATGVFMGALQLVVVLLVFAFIIAFVVLVHEGERRIPVQNARAAAGGRSGTGVKSQSHIPLKVNIAGVLPIIFAVSIMHFPAQIHGFFGNEGLGTVVRWLNFTDQGAALPIHPFGVLMYMVLIFAFTHFYTSFAVNPVEMAENMKKNGGFIPGIRPGKPTSDYIAATVKRLSWIGSCFYALIALTPILLDWFTAVPIGFGGTTILIVIGVALEFVKQLESQLLMRHYKGFLS